MKLNNFADLASVWRELQSQDTPAPNQRSAQPPPRPTATRAPTRAVRIPPPPTTLCEHNKRPGDCFQCDPYGYRLKHGDWRDD